MPKGSEELTSAREREIIAACEKLYQTMSFKEITIKEIGNATSFTRTSIYNYFQTKEEIFLALLKQEYELWIAELKSILAGNESLTRAAFADKLSTSLAHRQQLLKILSMNLYDIEENSRKSRLVEFKLTYKASLCTVEALLKKFFPAMTAEERQSFLYQFYPFIYGIYPYTMVTDKQREAMQEAGVDYAQLSVYEITQSCLMRLLPEQGEEN